MNDRPSISPITKLGIPLMEFVIGHVKTLLLPLVATRANRGIISND